MPAAKTEWIGGNYGGTDTFLTTNAELATGTWYHIALVDDAEINVVSGYLDGVRVASGTGFNNSGSGGSSRQLSLGSWVTPNTLCIRQDR